MKRSELKSIINEVLNESKNGPLLDAMLDTEGRIKELSTHINKTLNQTILAQARKDEISDFGKIHKEIDKLAGMADDIVSSLIEFKKHVNSEHWVRSRKGEI